MNRKLIMEAIEKAGGNVRSLEALRRAFKYLSDTNLLALAIDLEIDTDSLLKVMVQS